jgi:hypothetical protein
MLKEKIQNLKDLRDEYNEEAEVLENDMIE